VSLVMRRIPMRMLKFWRSTCDVQMRLRSGIPMMRIGTASTTSPGLQRCSPSRGAP
jgi:hypothetical protein